MEYFKKNLDNSTILPYDVMRTIYEYADANMGIRRQIENGECNLDDIMYERMKRYILKTFITQYYSYMLSKYDENGYENIIITNENINDPKLKDKMLNWKHGYKHYFLLKSQKPPSICGIETYYSKCYLNEAYFRYCMLEQVKVLNADEKAPYVRYDLKSTSQLYKLWIKI